MENIAQRWDHVKQILLPFMEKCLGPMTEKEQRLVTILEIIQLDRFFEPSFSGPGRKKKDRVAIGYAFVAKMVYNLATTRDLIDRLQSSPRLRRICGWSCDNPHEGFARRSPRFPANRPSPARSTSSLRADSRQRSTKQ